MKSEYFLEMWSGCQVFIWFCGRCYIQYSQVNNPSTFIRCILYTTELRNKNILTLSKTMFLFNNKDNVCLRLNRFSGTHFVQLSVCYLWILHSILIFLVYRAVFKLFSRYLKAKHKCKERIKLSWTSSTSSCYVKNPHKKNPPKHQI